MAEMKRFKSERKIVQAFDKARAKGYRYTYQTFKKQYLAGLIK